MTQYDCMKDKPQEYKQTFGYALADDSLDILTYGDGPTVVIVTKNRRNDKLNQVSRKNT